MTKHSTIIFDLTFPLLKGGKFAPPPLKIRISLSVILDRENSVILNIEYKIDSLILRIRFLKTRIKFDRFIKEKRKKLNVFQFLSIFSGILKHRIKNKHLKYFENE